jgi:putative transposase
VRYKAVLVEGAGYYYETLLDYVHLNPVRAGLADRRNGQSVLDYAWSRVSGGHALAPRRRPPWLATQDALWAFGFEDTAAGRRRWVERLDDRARAEAMEKCGISARREEDDARRSDLRRGWYWGSQAFAERMLRIGEAALRKTRSRGANASFEKQAHGEQEAATKRHLKTQSSSRACGTKFRKHWR